MVKFYKCLACGSIVAKLNEVGCQPSCCGQPMKELVALMNDGAVEKHVPVIEKEGNVLHVAVGSVAHPMLPEHFIEWIYLLTDKGGSFRFLKPGDAPKADFALVEDEKPIEVYAYCNLHGLWKSAI